MKIAVISFTPAGKSTAERVVRFLETKNHQVIHSVKCASVKESYEGTLEEWTRQQFQTQDAIVFVGAVGIAVRGIAPFLCSKKTDPAVLVIDEQGKYCIPILSGHIGGANELADLIAKAIQAEPVITTATDLNRKWAVDVFATKNQLYITDMKKAKHISAAVLQNRKLSMKIEGGEYEGRCPEEIELLEEDAESEADICVSIRRPRELGHTLYLVPRSVILGVGCRRDVSAETIEEAVLYAVEQTGIWMESISKAASIDMKSNESGILRFCKKYYLPFETFGKEKLMKAEGEFTASPFVENIVGVDNVCERSAICAGGNRLICEKTVCQGETVALAVKTWGCCFE